MQSLHNVEHNRSEYTETIEITESVCKEIEIVARTHTCLLHDFMCVCDCRIACVTERVGMGWCV